MIFLKTRIISAVVGSALFAVIIAVSTFKPLVLGVVLSALCAMGVYEVLNNTGIVKVKAVTIVALVASVIFSLSIVINSVILALLLNIFYFLVVVALTLKFHESIDMSALFATFCAPVILSYAFSFIYHLFTVNNTKCFFFALIFAFSWGSDTLAYFSGRFFGKKKLCPNISPKKTVEGFIGGIIGSVVISLIIYFIYKNFITIKMSVLQLVLLSAVFSVIGVMGDLFASIIKRKTGIKDYGSIMPGHGGVLDRFDSVLLISPLLYLAISVLSLS